MAETYPNTSADPTKPPDTQRPPQQAPRLMDRRGFLGLAFGGAAAMVANRAIGVDNDQNKEREVQFSRLIELIRVLNSDELKDIESANFLEFVHEAEAAYYAVTDVRLESNLSQSTSYFITAAEFESSIRQIEPTYVPKQKHFGYRHNETQQVFINLESLIAEASMDTVYPARVLLQVLFHEWSHQSVRERTTGTFVNNDKYTIKNNGDDEKREVIERYAGGEIITENLNALQMFDEAWTDLIAQKAVVDSLSSDAELLTAVPDATRYAKKRQWLSRVVQQTGLSTKQLASMHATSDFEGFARRLGQVFEQTALELLSTEITSKFSQEELQENADFLIGQYFASRIHKGEVPVILELFKHIKKP